MQDIRKTVGGNIRRLRDVKGLTQEELASKCDEMDRTYLSGIERGIRNPTIVVVQRIADALGVPPNKLLEK
jgi:transcriptional regulator with XRE-family HTH domain